VLLPPKAQILLFKDCDITSIPPGSHANGGTGYMCLDKAKLNNKGVKYIVYTPQETASKCVNGTCKCQSICAGKPNGWDDGCGSICGADGSVGCAEGSCASNGWNQPDNVIVECFALTSKFTKCGDDDVCKLDDVNGKAFCTTAEACGTPNTNLSPNAAILIFNKTPIQPTFCPWEADTSRWFKIQLPGDKVCKFEILYPKGASLKAWLYGSEILGDSTVAPIGKLSSNGSPDPTKEYISLSVNLCGGGDMKFLKIEAKAAGGQSKDNWVYTVTASSLNP
jgi:hypothetical protein